MASSKFLDPTRHNNYWPSIVFAVPDQFSTHNLGRVLAGVEKQHSCCTCPGAEVIRTVLARRKLLNEKGPTRWDDNWHGEGGN